MLTKDVSQKNVFYSHKSSKTSILTRKCEKFVKHKGARVNGHQNSLKSKFPKTNDLEKQIDILQNDKQKPQYVVW